MRSAPSGGDGSQTSPVNTLAEMQALQNNEGDAEDDDCIVVLGEDRMPYTGSLRLLDGQELVGTGNPVIIDGVEIIPAGPPPVLENLSLVIGETAETPVIDLGDDNEVMGLTVDGAQGYSLAD